MMAVGKNLHIIQCRDLPASQRIEFSDLLDFIAEEADPPGRVLIMRWENLKIIPAHPEIPTGKGCVVALVLKGHQLADDLTLVRRFALLHREGRSEEHTSELQSLMRISYAVFCLK